jgi:hypothetical protein
MIQKTLTSFFAAPQPSAKTELEVTDADAVQPSANLDKETDLNVSSCQVPAKNVQEEEEEKQCVEEKVVQDVGVGKENETPPIADGPCDYEKMRAERMQRNRNMLRELQVDQVLKQVTAKPKRVARPAKERKKRKKPATSAQPVRRSTRRSTRSTARLDPLTQKQYGNTKPPKTC